MVDVDLKLDLCAIDLEDDSFDAVICSHVLEHVDDDGAAMHELARITKRWLLVMVPIDLGRTETYEDPSITDPAGQERLFWPFGHVRVYAPDIEQRLAEAGLEVEVIRPRQIFGPETFDHAGLA